MTKSTKHVICRSKDVILVNWNYMFQKHVIYPIQFAHYIFLWELHVIGADYIIQGNYYMFCFPSVSNFCIHVIIYILEFGLVFSDWNESNFWYFTQKCNIPLENRYWSNFSEYGGIMWPVFVSFIGENFIYFLHLYLFPNIRIYRRYTTKDFHNIPELILSSSST